MTSSSGSFTYFSLLGLSSDSSTDELKRAFRREAKRWHPDLNKGNPLAELRFRWINESYSVLKDPQKRLEWEISGKPGFEITTRNKKRDLQEADSSQERSTNGDTNFSSAEKLILFIVILISIFSINTFPL